jgi:hypothetical protein
MAIALKRGKSIPDFTLSDLHGITVSSRNYYMRRNLVIALLPENTDDTWKEWITLLSAAVQSIPDQDAVCLMVFPPMWKQIIDDLYSDGDQIKLLIDTDGVAKQRLDMPESRGRLIITDRYGVIFHAADGEASDSELDPSDVPAWIELITCRCS